MNILERIAAEKREEVKRQKRKVSEAALVAAAKDVARRDFAAAIAGRLARQEIAIIAEIKKASPSAGVIRRVFDPAAIARSYEAAGAACLSVLTEARHFQGSASHLAAARAACSLPVLRKDFLVDPYQVVEAAAMGADCILIILAMVDDALAWDLAQAASDFKLSVLAEVHSLSELERALKLPAHMIGINNRDLRSFKTDLAISESLAPAIPQDRIIVAESGIHSRKDLQRLIANGIRAFLIGEALMRASDPGHALAELMGRQA